MHCPNCGAPKLFTFETYPSPTRIYRVKKCKTCQWKFTSHEEIADDLVIPESVRSLKKKVKS